MTANNLTAIHDKYRQSFAEKLDVLNTAWREVEQAQSVDLIPALTRLADWAHKLRGSAGMYEYQALQQASGEFEDELRCLVDDNNVDLSVLAAPLKTLRECLQSEVV